MRSQLFQHLSESVLFEFGTVPESRINWGSGFILGEEVYSGGGGGVRKGVEIWNLFIIPPPPPDNSCFPVKNPCIGLWI